VRLAEGGQLDAALAAFSAIIAAEPLYAPAYNNRCARDAGALCPTATERQVPPTRAQVLQLRGDTDGALRDATAAVASAFDDMTLRQARALAPRAAPLLCTHRSCGCLFTCLSVCVRRCVCACVGCLSVSLYLSAIARP
jgi:hypothetical protein